MDTRKSLSGYVFTLFGTASCWKENLQPVVALSTTESEYIANQVNESATLDFVPPRCHVSSFELFFSAANSTYHSEIGGFQLPFNFA